MQLCKSNHTSPLIGRWQMTTGNQEMIFHTDSTMAWILFDQFYADTFEIKYRQNRATMPKQLNLFGFKRGILKDKILAGIMQEKGKDTLILDFRPAEDWLDADTIRPLDFDPDEMRFLIKAK